MIWFALAGTAILITGLVLVVISDGDSDAHYYS